MQCIREYGRKIRKRDKRQESLFKQTMQRNRGKQQNRKDQRSLQENWRYQGNISCKDGHDKGQKQ